MSCTEQMMCDHMATYELLCINGYIMYSFCSILSLLLLLSRYNLASLSPPEQVLCDVS